MQTYISSMRILESVIFKGKSLDNSFAPGDSPLAKQVSYGVLRDYYRLKSVVGKLLQKPLPTKHNDIFLLLLSGIYSIDSLRRPAYTSVNAAVQCTASLNKGWSKGLVNAVLRNYIRKSSELNEQIEPNTEAATNLPKWLYSRIVKAWPGKEHAIATACNHEPPMTLRVVNSWHQNKYDEALQAIEITSHWGRLHEHACYLSAPVPVDELPGFSSGEVSVQDEASQLAALLLDLEPGQQVLDACAAPGGKSCHILQKCPEVTLTAIDKDPNRLDRVNANLERIAASAKVIACDLNDYKPAELFDRILLDAPCSATGIIRRHPDIKLLRRESDIDKLAATQAKLLNVAWDLLKVGGKLLYSTCSILPEENEDIVSAFCHSNTDAIVDELSVSWGIQTTTGRQLLPTASSHDGFFYARLIKKDL
ncbi:MAG: 16S rRNA (cytosine967-C5)-methyltransferase [Candidatus Azotimanducaceae bacterium]|jgi:16S rRNA (cytosine967-C5)-methyltransferase